MIQTIEEIYRDGTVYKKYREQFDKYLAWMEKYHDYISVEASCRIHEIFSNPSREGWCLWYLHEIDPFIPLFAIKELLEILELEEPKTDSYREALKAIDQGDFQPKPYSIRKY